jgi:DNA-directed RNA polymerase subunit E'/Rpb7
MLKAVKNYHYNTEQKILQLPGRRNLEEFVFDAFMPVFCVLTMEIMEGVVSCVTDEGVRVHGASHK